MDSQAWRDAFESVRRDREFSPLNELLGIGPNAKPASPGINETLEWDGAFLTPLFIAVLLRLDDHLPQLCLRGAAMNVQCLFEGFLCGPLHAAALQGDCSVISALLDCGCDANVSDAETALLDKASSCKVPLSRCNALHMLVAKDIFAEPVYRLLLSRGTKLSGTCIAESARDGPELSGLSLPRQLGNVRATEAALDSVLHEEIMHTIKSPGLAKELNKLLDVGSTLRRSRRDDVAYSFARSLDYRFSSKQDEEPTALVLYAADVGNCEALRLLLYSGADPTVLLQRALPLGTDRVMILSVGVLHLAALRGDLAMIEQLIFFGIDPASPPCNAVVYDRDVQASDESHAQEHWRGLSLLHLAVLSGNSAKLSGILRHTGDIDVTAERFVGSDTVSESISVLHLAALQDDVDCTSVLLDLGATVSDPARAAALERTRVCEMFGGPPIVGFDEWLEALLTGESALQSLINRRTDLSRVFEFPELHAPGAATAFVEQLAHMRLASPELMRSLAKSLEEVPSLLRAVRPVHLACLLQQPWAVEVLASNGVLVGESTPPCHDVPRRDAPLPGSEGNAPSHFSLDLVFLCVRTGSLQVLEMLVRDPRFALHIGYDIPLVPDITPPYFPRRHPAGDDFSLTWAWCRLGPLEFAILHRRIDVAVLLCRLGADLLHTVDHASLRPPQHYSVTDHCFRNLTALHLCALLDFRLAASALLHEACDDASPVMHGEHTRPQRQALLSASACRQCWATVDTAGDEAKEPWLWRDLTPLHLAIIAGSTDTAELLVDASSASALNKICLNMDASGDVERSFSPLLLAFERGYKDLHRKIAKKFPSC